MGHHFSTLLVCCVLVTVVIFTVVSSDEAHQCTHQLCDINKLKSMLLQWISSQ